MKRPPLDIQAAARVAPRVQLKDVYYLTLGASYVIDGETPTDLSLSWTLAPLTASWLRNEQAVQAIFPFQIRIDGKSEAAPDKPIRIAEVVVTMRAEYGIPPGTDIADGDLGDFVGINGYIHLWPYLRAEVQQLTAKIGLPALTLPVQLSGNAVHTVSVAHASELEGGPRSPQRAPAPDQDQGARSEG